MNNPHGSNPRLELFGANLSPNEARLLLIDAGSSLLVDEGLMTFPSRRQFAAEYIGRLFDAVDARDAFDGVVADEFPGEPTGMNMGVLIKFTATDMRVAYGAPELQGTESPLNPQYYEGGLDTAIEAEDGVEAVRRHIETAYAQIAR